MARTRKVGKRDIARPKWSIRRWSQSSAIPIPPESAPASLNARISPSECRCQNADAPPHQVDECVLKEMGEPVGRLLPALRLLQFLPDSSLVARDSRDGSRNH